jgi:hypothetical protein
MLMREMLAWIRRFKGIMAAESTTEIRDARLGSLMTDLEIAYQIPALSRKKFENENPFVMQLYRAVSEARSF